MAPGERTPDGKIPCVDLGTYSRLLSGDVVHPDNLADLGPSMIESLRQRTLTQLMKMPFHSFEMVLKKRYNPILIARTTTAGLKLELHKGNKVVFSQDEDNFGTVMTAVRDSLAEATKVNIVWFPPAALVTNGLSAIAQLHQPWHDHLFSQHLEIKLVARIPL